MLRPARLRSWQHPWQALQPARWRRQPAAWWPGCGRGRGVLTAVLGRILRRGGCGRGRIGRRLIGCLVVSCLGSIRFGSIRLAVSLLSVFAVSVAGDMVAVVSSLKSLAVGGGTLAGSGIGTAASMANCGSAAARRIALCQGRCRRHREEGRGDNHQDAVKSATGIHRVSHRRISSDGLFRHGNSVGFGPQASGQLPALRTWDAGAQHFTLER